MSAPGLTAVADPSLVHVLRRLELVEARVRAAVARRRATDPETDDRFRGLYISQVHVDRLLAEKAGPVAPDPDAAKACDEIEAAADGAEREGADLRLRRLARNFHLDEIDIELLLIAMAPDVDARFERLYGYLQDDVSRRRASVGLGLELCGLPSSSAYARSRLAPGAPLVDEYLVQVEENDRPVLTRPLRVPDRVAAHLLGSDIPDAGVASLAYESEPAAPEQAATLVRWMQDEPSAESPSPLGREGRGGGRLAYIRERPGASGAALASSAFAQVGRPTLALDLERLRPEDDLAIVAALTAREAGLTGAGVVAGPVEVLIAKGLPAVRAFSEMPSMVVLVGARSWDPGWARDVPFICEAPIPDAVQRAELWRRNLNGDTPPGLDLAGTMAQFRLTAEQVHRAALAARMEAHAREIPLDEDELKAGARAQNAAGLERLARRIQPAVGFVDLVLPPDTMAQLKELLTRARYREQVLDVWKMGGPSARRRGLTALFAGPSGTGKTMAAEVLASELGLDLYTVDLATVVDKYVGETEKNLDRIFAEAERVNGVILFDEADALFGKRSEVSDAHDRYANVEVAYLLQRMELFDGIAILATNLRSNLDEAFTRRLDSLVDFPEPEREYRLKLWERSLGTAMPRAGDLDLAFLAESFKLAGGGIRNIVVAAAYAAAEQGQPLSMAHLIRATQREYLKMGRLCVESEFGPYYHFLG
ncbi:MAG TPA: ATP-binding protein [Candidatus Dormibacteraeota bacterium]|nr:ATP-binding protein [Candidatus Dormibacteraeota bacterium]